MRILVSLLSVFLLVTSCTNVFDTIPSPPVKYHDPEPHGAFSGWGIPVAGFCNAVPDAVLCVGNHNTAQLDYKTIYAIDVELRGRFIYHDDWELYHSHEHWTNWVISGDCEDYALTLSELLSYFGEDAHNMRLVLIRIITPFGQFGHAMLAVKTPDVGWTLIGVNAMERPNKGTDRDIITPDSEYNPMVQILMDGTRRVIAFPGYITDGKSILQIRL